VTAQRTLTCGDAAAMLDAFVDGELERAALIDVARHAAVCRRCDGTLRELMALHDAIGAQGRVTADAVDLSGLWPALLPELDRADARRMWRRRLRAAPVWGGLAIAATALLWLGTTRPTSTTQVAARARPNHAVIERIDTDAGRIELRRERKNGTTLIMVSATDDVSQ
jgi:hypothetical protein